MDWSSSTATSRTADLAPHRALLPEVPALPLPPAVPLLLQAPLQAVPARLLEAQALPFKLPAPPLPVSARARAQAALPREAPRLAAHPPAALLEAAPVLVAPRLAV